MKKRIAKPEEKLKAYETLLASGEEGPLWELLAILEAANSLPAWRLDVLDILIPVNIHIGLHSRYQDPAAAFQRARAGIRELIAAEEDVEELYIAYTACRILAEDPMHPHAPDWLVEHGFIRCRGPLKNTAEEPQDVNPEEYLGRELPY